MQVYIAFITTAGLTVFASIVAFFSAWKSGEDVLPVSTDMRLLQATTGPLVISLADQQMVAGLAILIAAFKDWNTISAYHFNLVVYIAWFSSFTHGVALISTTALLMKNMILLVLRLVGFTAVFALYVVAQARSRTYGDGKILWYLGTSKYPDAAAACLAKCCAAQLPSHDGGEFQIGALVLYLFLGAVNWLLDSLESTKRRPMSFLRQFVKFVIMIISVALLLVAGVSASILRDVSRYDGLVVANDFGDQNAWSFGQLVAVILLILPLLAALEGFFGKLSP